MTNEYIEKADRDLFDSIAIHYAKKDIYKSSSHVRKCQILSALSPILDENRNLGTIVDVGCGVGAPAMYLQGYYEYYFGIDQSAEMIRAAKAFNASNPKAEFLVENIKDTHLKRNLADVVLSVGALHHMIELETVLESLVGIAKPNARLVVIEPQNGNPFLQMLRRFRMFIDNSYSDEQIFFSEKDLKDLFARHGINDLLIDYQGYFSPPFAQVILRPQFIFVPLSHVAWGIDAWLQTSRLPSSLKYLSFNIVMIGRFS